MHTVLRGLAIMLALGLVAGNAFAQSAGDHPTIWFAPTGHKVSVGCVYDYTIQPTTPDQPTPDQTNRSCELGVQAAYAATIAWDMQIHGFAWAKDECNGAASAAKSSSSAGQSTVFRVAAGSNPSPVIRCDWKPKFKLRVEIISAPAHGEAGGTMKGDCSNVNVHVHLQQTLVGKSDADTTVVTVGPAGIPLTTYVGQSSQEIALNDYQFDQMAGTSETATYSCSVWVNATADDNPPWDWWSECASWAFDSMPGLDVDARCATCGSYAYVLYGWY